MYVCMYVYIYIYMCVCVYIYIYIYCLKSLRTLIIQGMCGKVTEDVNPGRLCDGANVLKQRDTGPGIMVTSGPHAQARKGALFLGGIQRGV